ncbi:MAG: hypothetical protein Q7S21_03920 [archaeon]|nr:hypothetical protein [archaeon]
MNKLFLFTVLLLAISLQVMAVDFDEMGRSDYYTVATASVASATKSTSLSIPLPEEVKKFESNVNSKINDYKKGSYGGLTCEGWLKRADEFEEKNNNVLKSNKGSIEYNLIKAITLVESGFDETKVNEDGKEIKMENPRYQQITPPRIEQKETYKISYGLMQVNGELLLGKTIRADGKEHDTIDGHIISSTKPANFSDISREWNDSKENTKRGVAVYSKYHINWVDIYFSAKSCNNQKSNIDGLSNISWKNARYLDAYNGGVGKLQDYECYDPRDDQQLYAEKVLAWWSLFETNCGKTAVGTSTNELKASLEKTERVFEVGKPIIADISGTVEATGKKITFYQVRISDSSPSNQWNENSTLIGKTAVIDTTVAEENIVPSDNKIIVSDGSTANDVGKWELLLNVVQDDGESASAVIEIEVVLKTPEEDESTITIDVIPTEEEPSTASLSCEDSSGNPICADVLTCLACIDGKFLNGVFK